SSNDVRLLRDAAIRGVGIALLSRFLVAPFLESGELVQVLPGVIEATTQIAVVYPERQFLPPHVRAFIDVLVQWTPAVGRSVAVPRPRKRRTRSVSARNPEDRKSAAAHHEG